MGFLDFLEMRGLALLMALVTATMARIPHADPAFVWIGVDLDRDNQLDANEQAALFSQTNDDGWAITKSAGGKPQLAMRKMDTNDDGILSSDEFFAWVTPRFYRGVAEEDFENQDRDENTLLDLDEYKNTNYAMDRVPDEDHEAFDKHFNQLDTDLNGKISRDEWLDIAGKDPFTAQDDDHDELVMFAEFKKHHVHHYRNGDEVEDAHDNLQAVFDDIDANNDGIVTRTEDAFNGMPEFSSTEEDAYHDDESTTEIVQRDEAIGYED